MNLRSVVPLNACSITKNSSLLIAAISPIFQSLKRIWFEPEVPITPSFKYANILVSLVNGLISKIRCTLDPSPIALDGYKTGL